MPRSKIAFNAMRENTRIKIEATALSLFARKGLSVTISEIANAGGISQGLLYSHYPSKDALIAELVRQAVSISGQSIKEAAQSDDSALTKINQITSMMCQMFTDHKEGIDYFMFMLQVGMSGFQTPSEALYTFAMPNPINSLAQILSQGQSEGSVIDGDSVKLATIYWALIQGLCCYAIMSMPLSLDPRMLNRTVLKEDFL